MMDEILYPVIFSICGIVFICFVVILSCHSENVSSEHTPPNTPPTSPVNE